LRELVEAYFECANTEQWERMLTLFTEDATYRTPGARPRVGREDVVAFYPKAFSAWATHQDTAHGFIFEGDSAACEIHFTGTTHDGRQIAFDCVDIFRFRDGQIAQLSTWYDLEPVRKAMQG
jgi:ketosteroid isomerase-like protein